MVAIISSSDPLVLYLGHIARQRRHTVAHARVRIVIQKPDNFGGSDTACQCDAHAFLGQFADKEIRQNALHDEKGAQ